MASGNGRPGSRDRWCDGGCISHQMGADFIRRSREVTWSDAGAGLDFAPSKVDAGPGFSPALALPPRPYRRFCRRWHMSRLTLGSPDWLTGRPVRQMAPVPVGDPAEVIRWLGGAGAPAWFICEPEFGCALAEVGTEQLLAHRTMALQQYLSWRPADRNNACPDNPFRMARQSSVKPCAVARETMFSS